MMTGMKSTKLPIHSHTPSATEWYANNQQVSLFTQSSFKLLGKYGQLNLLSGRCYFLTFQPNNKNLYAQTLYGLLAENNLYFTY